MKLNIRLFNRLVVAFILCFYLFFFLLFLQPFDSINYNHPYKTLQFFGYGLIAFFSYLISGFISYRFQIGFVKEFILYFLIGSFQCYLYTTFVMNNDKYFDFKEMLLWIVYFPLPVFITMLPFIYFFKRVDFHKNLFNLLLKKIEFKGENTNEYLEVEPKNVIYAEALENYVSIYFLEDNVFKGKIFRNKLKNIEEQSKGVLQFCHRSYLVNGDYVSEILKEGHKQYLVLHTEDKKIPLSKSYIDKFSSKSL